MFTRYNSVFSTTVSLYSHPYLVVTESFFSGAPINNPLGFGYDQTTVDNMRRFSSDPLRYENISKLKCLERYSDPFSGFSDVMVVVEDDMIAGEEDSDAPNGTSVLEYVWLSASAGRNQLWSNQILICSYGYYKPYPENPKSIGSWADFENPDCRARDFSQQRIQHWNKWNHRVKYCLSLRVDDHCFVNFSPVIGIGSFSLNHLQEMSHADR